MSSGSAQLILQELGETLPKIDEAAYESFYDELTKPGRRVLLMGVGRVMIALKAWVKRLSHLEIDVNYVGSENEQALRKNDLLVVGSSSGESALPVAIANLAKKIGANVAYVGCSPESTIAKISDVRLILFGRTKYSAPTEYPSKQPMSSLFEQQLFLLGDVIALDIMERRGWTEANVKSHHANLE
ncbi:MAG: SIS domain-containing protein [Eubacteriales bacterium]|nr:SIS domain-containing protein [Eubacteriales bacterium]